MPNEKARGVALFLVAPSGAIWTVEELCDKPRFGKRAGDWSVPMETCERDETDFDALSRLSNEEIGVGVRINETRGLTFLCEVDIRGEADVRVYVAHFVSAEQMVPPPAFRTEVSVVGWREPEEILGHRCREGVRAMLAAYREYRESTEFA